MVEKYRAEQDVAFSGFDCGTEVELKMVVTFRVCPALMQTVTDPGEDASVEVDTVRFFDGFDEVKLPSLIEERFTSADGFKDWLMADASDQRQSAIEDAAEARREMMKEAICD